MTAPCGKEVAKDLPVQSDTEMNVGVSALGERR